MINVLKPLALLTILLGGTAWAADTPAPAATPTQATAQDAFAHIYSEKRTDFDRVMFGTSELIGRAHKRALDDAPTLTGEVRLRVKVSGDGRVTSVSLLSSTLGGHVLERQIVAIVQALTFASGFKDFEGTFTYSVTAQ